MFTPHSFSNNDELCHRNFSYGPVWNHPMRDYIIWFSPCIRDRWGAAAVVLWVRCPFSIIYSWQGLGVVSTAFLGVEQPRRATLAGHYKERQWSIYHHWHGKSFWRRTYDEGKGREEVFESESVAFPLLFFLLGKLGGLDQKAQVMSLRLTGSFHPRFF